MGRVLKPLIVLMTKAENARNEPHSNLLYGHVSNLRRKLPPKGSNTRRNLKDNFLFGYVTGQEGAGEEIISPIDGLFDIDDSQCVSTQYEFPKRVTHSVELFEGATFEPQIVDQSDLDDMSRLKGFGGPQAKQIISQALGIRWKGGGGKGDGKGKGKGKGGKGKGGGGGKGGKGFGKGGGKDGGGKDGGGKGGKDGGGKRGNPY